MCLLKILPKPDQRQEVLDLLRSVKGPTEVRPGCIETSVFEEKDPDGRILFLEQWSSRKAFEEHVISSLFNRILTAMELAVEPPDICFYEVSQTKGLDFVETLRSSAPKPAGEDFH